MRSGRVAAPLWTPVFAASGTGVRSSLHSHHAWHLMVGLDGPLLVQGSARETPRPADAVITRPDVLHAADSDGHEVLVVFVSPESDVGAQLRARPGDGIEILPRAVADRIRRVLRSPLRTRAQLTDGARVALAELGIGQGRASVRHPAVRKVLLYLRSNQPGSDESLDALAALSGLSSSRLMHVFTEQVGVPLRPYLRWLKLERATLLLAAGASATDAAYRAGFADAAHMARSFRAMLGTTPAEIRRSQSVQAG